MELDNHMTSRKSPAANAALALAEALARRSDLAEGLAGALRRGDAREVQGILPVIDEASRLVSEAAGAYSAAQPSLGTAIEMRQLLGRLTERAKLADRQVWSALEEAGTAGIVEWLADRATVPTLPRQVPPRHPDDPAALHASASQALREGRRDEAVELWRQSTALEGAPAAAWFSLGACLREQGRAAEALSLLQQAILLAPDLAAAHVELGLAFADAELPERAIEAFKTAINLDPNLWQAWLNLGAALTRIGTLVGAVTAWERAVELQPACAEAWSNLGGGFKDLGMQERAEACSRRAVSLQPGLAPAHSNLLLTLHYHRGDEGVLLYQEHLEFARVHADRLAAGAPAFDLPRDPARRLRVGYVSPDFRSHPVGEFFRSLVGNHDRSQVDVICFSDVVAPDAVSRAIRNQADGWRDVAPLDDAQVVELIRKERIDVLVDLAGHTGRNRLLAFARRAAPVQASWLGYPDTTGLAAMDLRLSDPWADPPGETDGFCRERLVRLPRCFLAWSPPQDAPEPTLPPTLESGVFTFGSFAGMAKICSRTVELWASVLRAVPGSRLLVKAGALIEVDARERLLRLLENAGVSRNRVELRSRERELSGHLGLYSRVDAALDTFPYSGTTTTCEALWMGVPVLTLAGPTHVSRVGVSLLSAAGHPEWVASSPEELVSLARELAADPGRLAQTRRSLRSELLASPLLDGSGLARALEVAYREAWGRWCRGGR